MTGEEWEQIKTADRLAADAEWRADPAFARAFFTGWGAGEGAALHLDESVPLSQENAPQWEPGQDLPVVEWD